VDAAYHEALDSSKHRDVLKAVTEQYKLQEEARRLEARRIFQEREKQRFYLRRP
jgi:hypothetical protein